MLGRCIPGSKEVKDESVNNLKAFFLKRCRLQDGQTLEGTTDHILLVIVDCLLVMDTLFKLIKCIRIFDEIYYV